MSASRFTTVECDWNGNPASFDVNSSSRLSDVWSSLKDVYPTLPPPFSKDGPLFRLTYVDSDGEEVELDRDSDLNDAISQAEGTQSRILQLFVRQPLHMARSGLLGEGEWEAVSDKSSAESTDPSPAVPVPVSAVEENAAQVAAVTPVQDKKEEKKEEASGWFFGLLGGRSSSSAPVPAPAVDADAAPAATVAAPLESQEIVASIDNSSAAAPLSESALVRADSEKEFYEMDVNSQELIDEQQAQSNSFVDAMDAQFPRPNSVWDSNVLTSDVLSFTLKQMLSRTETRLGVPSSTPSASCAASSFVPAPHQALLAALKGIQAERFEPVINQFVQVCAEYVEEREVAAQKAAEELARVELEAAERAQQEAMRLEEEKRQLEEKLKLQARLEAELAAQRAAELEKAKLLEAVQQRKNELEANLAAMQAAMKAENEQLELMAKKMSELKAAELKREREELARAAAEVEVLLSPKPQPVEQLQQAPASMPPMSPVQQEQAQPVQAYVDPSVYPPVAAAPLPVLVPQQPVAAIDQPSPVMVPMVPIPVATPLQANAQSVASRFNHCMQELRDMGFTDDALNTYLLQKTNLDVASTLDWLMSDQACGGELKREVQHLLQV